MKDDAEAARSVSIESALKSRKLETLGGSLGPRAATEALNVSAEKKPVLGVLDEMVLDAKIENHRKSKVSVSSGLEAFHFLATCILGYPDRATLPPRSSLDVQHFIVMFKSVGTALNYIACILWACRSWG